jgi:hypothetical protein
MVAGARLVGVCDGGQIWEMRQLTNHMAFGAFLLHKAELWPFLFVFIGIFG